MSLILKTARILGIIGFVITFDAVSLSQIPPCVIPGGASGAGATEADEQICLEQRLKNKQIPQDSGEVNVQAYVFSLKPAQDTKSVLDTDSSETDSGQ